MGAKTWMLVYADGNARDLLTAKPKLDRDATTRLAKELFPKDGLQTIADGTLSYASPPDDEITIGYFPGVSVVAAAEFGIDYPSTLPPRFLRSAAGRTVYLHAMHSVVDWFAFAVWQDGQLKRSLSLSPDSGVLEDIGAESRLLLGGMEVRPGTRHDILKFPACYSGQDSAGVLLPWDTPVAVGSDRGPGSARHS